MRQLKNENMFDRTLSLILCICGVLSNSAGIIISITRDYLGSPIWHRPFNITTCIASLTIIIIASLIAFHRKAYSSYGIVITSLTGFCLFPAMFISTGNVMETFLLYMLIIPTAYGVSIRKKWHLILPFINLALYWFLFFMAFHDIFNIYPENTKTPSFKPIPLYISFSTVYMFSFWSTKLSVSEVINALHDLNELASKDELTQIYNRRSFDEDIQIFNYKFGIMIDIDHFKSINDTFGHQKGDEALINLAYILKDYCCNEFRLYRYGGEEFFILSRFSEEATILRMKKIYKDIHAIFKVVGKPITICCGMSENIKDNPTDFIQEADAQMYQAKHSGRDRMYYQGLRVNLSLD